MSAKLTVPLLVGTHVRLEPLGFTHVEGLVGAANGDRSSYGYMFVPTTRDEMANYVDDLLGQHENGLSVPFVQVDVQSQRVVGATRFMTIRTRENESTPYAVEVGGTWLTGSAQRTAINSEAKLLLFTYAFDTWNVGRVDLKGDARNTRSRNAMARIGATFEGVLRQWQPSMVAGEEKLLRDTAMYSVTADEWPTVRSNLEMRII
jgi:RimJ/RimL family protein N-acetyltransferase